jgi:ferredoxin-NADP reductase
VRVLAREYPDASFYLCGRRAHMEAMEHYLADAGVAPERVAALNFRSEAEWYAGASGSWPMARIVEPDAPVHRRAATATTRRVATFP